RASPFIGLSARAFVPAASTTAATTFRVAPTSGGAGVFGSSAPAATGAPSSTAGMTAANALRSILHSPCGGVPSATPVPRRGLTSGRAEVGGCGRLGSGVVLVLLEGITPVGRRRRGGVGNVKPGGLQAVADEGVRHLLAELAQGRDHLVCLLNERSLAGRAGNRLIEHHCLLPDGHPSLPTGPDRLQRIVRQETGCQG